MAGNAVRVSSRVTVKDKGLKELRKAIAEASKFKLTVGVHGDEGAAAHKGTTLSVADIAIIHELGLGNPKRPFIGGWFDTNRDKNEKMFRAAVKTAASGKWSMQQALERLGARFKGDVQRGFSSPPLLPNAASTIRIKGSDVPLVNFGQLRASIDYQVTKKAIVGGQTVVSSGNGTARKKQKKKDAAKARKKKIKDAKKKLRTAARDARKTTRKAIKGAKKSVKKTLKTAKKKLKPKKTKRAKK